MDIETIRIYCLSKPATEASFPFDENTLVFKVMGKMFALCGLERFPLSINLKCDPEYALELRDMHDALTAGYHMSKKHWNTIEIEAGLSDKFIKELIDHSYQLVVSKLPKKLQAELTNYET